MYYEELEIKQIHLNKKIAMLEAEIKSLPPGKLICSKNHSGYKWYQSDGHEKEYISKKDKALAERLAIKKYLSYKLDEYKLEHFVIKFALNHLKKEDQKKSLSILTSPGYAELLSPKFQVLSEELNEWMRAPFETNKLNPEALKHRTPFGCNVRSKSEALIASALYVKKIPFRYECMIALDGVVVYPDFTLRHPKNGKTVYWEHFGMMDKASYIDNCANKLHTYMLNGIVPSINLITTYETIENPLTSDTIEKVIEGFLDDWR